MLKIFPTEKSLVVSFWTFFQISWQSEDELERTETPNIFVDAVVSF